MEGWVFDQRAYTEYRLLTHWTMANKPSGDFSQDIRFSKPLNGASCPGVVGGTTAEGCQTGDLVTNVGGRAASCSGTSPNRRCACLAFGATRSALCAHAAGAGCVAKESVSQNIRIPWNAKELKFKHRRDNPGGMQSQGWVRLVINRPGVKPVTPPACQTCPGFSGTPDEGPCDSQICNSATCQGTAGCPDWTYVPAVCAPFQTCAQTTSGSDVLWETRCEAVGNGPSPYCSMPCADNSACTLDELTNYIGEAIDITPYTYNVDLATRINGVRGTCETTVVASCAAANVDESTCTNAGACAFIPASGGVPDACTTTVVVECAAANADANTCTSAGACTYTAAPTQYDYASRLTKLRDEGDSIWTISFQAHTVDLWSVYVDDLTMTFFRPGCMDPLACNYGGEAGRCSDGSATTQSDCLTLSPAGTWTDLGGPEVDDGTCVLKKRGCTDARSANYDPNANTDPGDMCITFEEGEANTLKDIQLGSVQNTPTLSIGRDTIGGCTRPGASTEPACLELTPTCVETASTSVSADTALCAAVSALANGTACGAVMTTADAAVAACMYTPAGTWNEYIPAGEYPYWSHQVRATPCLEELCTTEAWTNQGRLAGQLVWDTPVGFKIKSDFANDLTLLVYKDFGPAAPENGLLQTHRTGHQVSAWKVHCEDEATGAEVEAKSCPNNGLVRTTLKAGEIYTVVVIPNSGADYQDHAESPSVKLPLTGQGKFHMEIFALRGAVKEVPPICGNGLVEGLNEQCDPKSGVEAEWCSPPPCAGLSTDLSSYSTGPDDYHWYTDATHCVAAYNFALRDGRTGGKDECPAGCKWSGTGSGGCQGIIASFYFDDESISLGEGGKSQVRINRRLPPDWLPYDTARVKVRAFTADGVGPNAASAEEDDYDDIESKEVVFEVCSDAEKATVAAGGSAECTEQFVQIETLVDEVFEYPSEHFFFILDKVCDDNDDCSQTTKLEYPYEMTVEIVNDPWTPGEVGIALIGIMCLVLLGIAGWLTSWAKGAHMMRYDKLGREFAGDFQQDLSSTSYSSGGVSPSPFRGSGNGSPSYRSGSIAPNRIASPSFNARRASVGLGAGGSRRQSVAPGNAGPGGRRQSVAPGNGGPGARRQSVAPGNAGPGGRRASVVPGNGGGARRASVAPGPARGGGGGGGVDEDALHSSVGRMGQRRAQSDGSRRKSVSAGGGRRGAGLDLADRMQGGEGTSGRRRRGSVKEISEEDREPEPTPKASSSGRRMRRGSVKEISLEPAKREITLGTKKSTPKTAAGSGERRRRGSVKEIVIPATKEITAASAFKEEGKKAAGSSGRRRRGSVKEIDPEDAPSAAPAKASASSSGRRRRGSVNEMVPEDGGLGKLKAATNAAVAGGASSSGRRRRGSVNEMVPEDGANGIAALTSASVTSSRRKGPPPVAQPKSGGGRRQSVAAGGRRRASIKPGADDMDAYPPGMVSKLPGFGDAQGVGTSRRQRGGPSPMASDGSRSPKSAKAGKSPKARSSASGSAGSDGTASPAVQEASRRGGGGYTNAAMYTAMQAALAHSEQVLDENKGLVGKCRLVGAAIFGGLTLAVALIVFILLTSSELDSCESETAGACLQHMVGNGHCDWECNIDECTNDGGDCEYYTSSCKFAWYHSIQIDENGGNKANWDTGSMCYDYSAMTIDPTTLNADNAFISPGELGDEPVEGNVAMGCFSTQEVGEPVGPSNGPTTFRLKDGKCDPACNFTACGWDGGDCEDFRLKASPQCSEGCYSHMMGDRICDPECDTQACFFDLRDCENSYTSWTASTAAHAQKAVPIGLPEALICDRETPAPGEPGFNAENEQCGLMNDATGLTQVYATNYAGTTLKSPGAGNEFPTAVRLQEEFEAECDEIDEDYLRGPCVEEKVRDFDAYVDGVLSTWRRLRRDCENTASAILQLHRETEIHHLVASLTHDHACQERCDTPSCGNDAGTCFADHWCAPGCSHDKLINLVCDQECFTAACGWDAPACNSCDAFVDSQAGLYADAIAALAESDGGSSGGMNLIFLALLLICLVILVMRIRSTIIVALDGYFEPLGKSLGRIWSKEDVASFDPGNVAKSMLDRYTAPLWPLAYAGPLLAEPKADWSEDQDDYNEDIGRYGLKYHSSAVEYSSEDSEPLRLELHQAQAAALATAMTLIFMLSFPASLMMAGAQPMLAGGTGLTEMSMGNLFDPESACKYPIGMHELLSNNLRLLWEEAEGDGDGDGRRLSEEEAADEEATDSTKPECGSATLAAHAVLIADLLVVGCFILLVHARHMDLSRLRKAHPRLSDYCVHVSGLGRGTKMASDIDRMVKQLKWLNEKDNADEVTVLPIWQDDLHWAWASIQKAELDAVGKGENSRGDVLQSLVHNLEASRVNVGYPRPFSGHAICIFNKQHMARAMLFTYKQPIALKLFRMLLPGEDDGGEEEPDGKKKSKVKVKVACGGDPDDIDWLSLRSGGSASFSDSWRGRAATIGALLSLASVLIISLAVIFNMKQVSQEHLTAAMGMSDAAAKATATLDALAVSSFSGSLLVVIMCELGAWIVSATVARAAPYNAHTFSGQRKAVVVVSSFAQICMLVLFPYMLLGDPYSWQSAGAVSATSVYGKCKPVIESQVNQQLPGAEYMPGGFAEMVLWLQVLNAIVPHLLRLGNSGEWPNLIKERVTGHGRGGKAHGWEFGFSLETSEAYVVRTVALALCFSVVQPVGFAIGAIGLLIGYSCDRLRAGNCTTASAGNLRRGAGVGDLYDHQVVLTLLQSVVALHALMLCGWIESVRMAVNPFVVNEFGLLDAPMFVYSIVELILVLISLGGKAQGLLCWLVLSYFIVTLSYQFIPLAGDGPLAEWTGVGAQPGGPNIVVVLLVVYGGIIVMPFFRPLSWFLGPMDPIEIIQKGKRESDEEAYYTQSEMPFKPTRVLDHQVACDVETILS